VQAHSAFARAAWAAVTASCAAVAFANRSSASASLRLASASLGSGELRVGLAPFRLGPHQHCAAASGKIEKLKEVIVRLNEINAEMMKSEDR
jgi:hypothetical protein